MSMERRDFHDILYLNHLDKELAGGSQYLAS